MLKFYSLLERTRVSVMMIRCNSRRVDGKFAESQQSLRKAERPLKVPLNRSNAKNRKTRKNKHEYVARSVAICLRALFVLCFLLQEESSSSPSSPERFCVRTLPGVRSPLAFVQFCMIAVNILFQDGRELLLLFYFPSPFFLPPYSTEREIGWGIQRWDEVRRALTEQRIFECTTLYYSLQF